MRLGKSVSVLLNYWMESVRLSVKIGDFMEGWLTFRIMVRDNRTNHENVEISLF